MEEVVLGSFEEVHLEGLFETVEAVLASVDLL